MILGDGTGGRKREETILGEDEGLDQEARLHSGRQLGEILTVILSLYSIFCSLRTKSQ